LADADVVSLGYGQSAEVDPTQERLFLVARFAAVSGDLLDVDIESPDSVKLVTFLVDESNHAISAGTTSLRTRAPHNGLYYIVATDAALRGKGFKVSLQNAAKPHAYRLGLAR
jgi:hypothetical protein